MEKKRFGKMLKGNGGFSLIELLVVITIMGILAAVAIPRFVNVLEQAKVRADESNVHTLKSAAHVFYFETGDWPAEGALNDEYTGDFKNYLNSFPKDPWDTPDTYYVMLPNGDVALQLVEPDDPEEPEE